MIVPLPTPPCPPPQGLGVRRKSVQRAFSYFTLASHAGHLGAMYNAAMMHLAGKGTMRCGPCHHQPSLLVIWCGRFISHHS